ncbi:hypothetical protein BD413DRAFT_572903 [Trametes elegans]|nr:hypothetical protein BD413DRAFT_572903 [Trametes elegans]
MASPSLLYIVHATFLASHQIHDPHRLSFPTVEYLYSSSYVCIVWIFHWLCSHCRDLCPVQYRARYLQICIRALCSHITCLRRLNAPCLHHPLSRIVVMDVFSMYSVCFPLQSRHSAAKGLKYTEHQDETRRDDEVMSKEILSYLYSSFTFRRSG